MNQIFKNLIEEQYPLQIKSISPGPRQFVAETYILEAENKDKYFCKIIPQEKYSDTTLKSLPVLKQMYQLGTININYPIETKEGELFVKSEKHLIILFNFIEGVQKFGYTHEQFAKLIAQIHNITSKINVPIIKENFSLDYENNFGKYIKKSLNPQKNDKYAKELQSIILKYSSELQKDWETFHRVIEECKNTDFDLVITHGDAPGNIMIAQNKEIYLIDWDTILLAPAERDTWFLENSSEFLNTYRKYFPEYEINQLTYKFYLFNRYFEDLLDFIEEILSNKSDEHKAKNLEDLKRDCIDTWLRPFIRNLKD